MDLSLLCSLCTGLCDYSKDVTPGDLFVVHRGAEPFAKEALERGACAFISEKPLSLGAKELIVPSTKALERELIAHFYGDPSEDLFIVAVTGTNGKSTTAYFVAQLLRKLSLPCGFLSTFTQQVGDKSYPARLTTPSLIEINRRLFEMKKIGLKACALEASSHGLVQGRLLGIKVDVAIFTGLSQDHLDYHGSLENYAKAKALLFSSLSEGALALFKGSDPTSKIMLEKCMARKKDFEDLLLPPSAMIGDYNRDNLRAAIAACVDFGFELDRLKAHLDHLLLPPGRLERVASDRNFDLFIDFAHTPEALEKTLLALREITQKKLWVAFGCGGDRDRGKRAKMGQIAAKLADRVILTRDNSRSENPLEIIQSIAEGIPDGFSFEIILDRQEAVSFVLDKMEEGDLFVLAGRGHEAFMEEGGKLIPCADRDLFLSTRAL